MSRDSKPKDASIFLQNPNLKKKKKKEQNTWGSWQLQANDSCSSWTPYRLQYSYSQLEQSVM